MNSSSPRFGIVGCGAIGPTHAGAIRQLGFPITAIADLLPDRLNTLADKYAVAARNATAEQLIADPNVDIVCLCTPSGLHAKHAVLALDSGKHVIVEKPMDVSLAACDAMIDAATRNKRVLSIISQHRFDPATQLARQLIDEGAIGKIVLASATVHWWRTQGYYDSGDWRGTWAMDGGGALMNQGVHTVDVLQWLAGGVASVFAHTRTSAHDRIEVEDIAVAALTFTNGAVGTLTATTAAYDGFPVRIEIFGTEGSIVLEGDNVKRIILKNGRKFDQQDASEHALRVARGGTASVKDDNTDRPAESASSWNWGDAHRAQIADVVTAIRTGSAPLIDGAQGRRPLQVILGIYQSARTGQVVSLA
jgi:UDP-N-acetyl-2-amino-2-deoxyglucuronate dehydrogenase